MFLLYFWVAISWLQSTLELIHDYAKWLIFELIPQVRLSIILNNLVGGHKTKQTKKICQAKQKSLGETFMASGLTLLPHPLIFKLSLSLKPFLFCKKLQVILKWKNMYAGKQRDMSKMLTCLFDQFGFRFRKKFEQKKFEQKKFEQKKYFSISLSVFRCDRFLHVDHLLNILEHFSIK